MMVPALARRYWQHRQVPSSSTRPRVTKSRVSASSSSASTTSSSASTSSMLPPQRHRLLLCVLSSGKIAVCLHTRRAPSSGKTRSAHRPRRFGLHWLVIMNARCVSVTLIVQNALAASFKLVNIQSINSVPHVRCVLVVW
jgi:hypothetical protein